MKITFKNDKNWKGSIKYYLFSFSYADNILLNIDRAGRVISFISQNMTENKITYKKAFDGTWMGIKRPSVKNQRERFQLTTDQIKSVYSEIEKFTSELMTHLQQEDEIEVSVDLIDVYNGQPMEEVLTFWLGVLDQVNFEHNNQDIQQFPSIYSNIGILPPDRYGSLVIQVTTGCVYNKCSFCTLYQGIEYSHKSPSILEKHVFDITTFMNGSLGRFHSIFLGDANALTIPYDDLLEIFQILNTNFLISQKKIGFIEKNKPSFEGIYSFLDVFTGFKLTKTHFKRLAELNLRMVYLGIETGSNDVLKILHKPNTVEKILSIISSLHDASIGVAVIFLIGAGGKEYQQDHVQESIKLIKQMELNSKDIIYLSKLFIYKQYYEIMVDNNIQTLSDSELESQYKIFKQELDEFYKSQNSKPIITRYELLDFIY